MRFVRRWTLLLAAGVLFVAAPALAQEVEPEIEVELGEAEGEPGETVEVGSINVPEGSVGAEYTGTIDVSALTAANAGNTLQIETGGATTEVEGVEDVAGGEPIVIDGVITAGETITISVVLEESGMFAGGHTVTLAAAEAAEAPAGGVASGAGGTAGNDTFPLVLLGVVGAALVALTGGYALRRRSQN